MKENRLIVIMGVSGSGKTTIGKELSKKLNIPFYDGDTFHPTSNIEKMAAGTPLNDRDRRPWLEAINEFAAKNLSESSMIIACSALKENYRDILARNIKITFIYLKGSAKLISNRIEERTGHFMPPELLDSQFEALEEPVNAITIEIDQSVDKIVEQAIMQLV